MSPSIPFATTNETAFSRHQSVTPPAIADGLYAAGDVVSALNQISVAVGHSAIAATAFGASPGVAEQVNSDLLLLRRATRTIQWLSPVLRRQQPLALSDELGTLRTHGFQVDSDTEALSVQLFG